MKIFVLLFVVFFPDGQVAWQSIDRGFSSYAQCKQMIELMHESAHKDLLIPKDAELTAHCVEFVKPTRT
jgi:hypothetical protein